MTGRKEFGNLGDHCCLCQLRDKRLEQNWSRGEGNRRVCALEIWRVRGMEEEC